MSGLKNIGQRHDDAFGRIDRSALVPLLAAYYRDVGWWVEPAGVAGTDARFDAGVDLRIRRDAEFVLVQCRDWNAQHLPHDAVDGLLEAIAREGATGGILIGSGEFSRAAIDAAQRHAQVKLIDGEGLRTMIGPLPEPGPEPFLPQETPVPVPAKRPPAARVRANLWLWLVALLSAVAFVCIVLAILDRTADTAVESAADGARMPASQASMPAKGML